MQKKRWQFYLILAVVVLTIYNILPTVFYYGQPLKKPIEQNLAKQIAGQIESRVNVLENESIKWLDSFCSLLKVKPMNIALDKSNPAHIKVQFAKSSDALRFKKFLPRAGSLISFTPAQLSLAEGLNTDDNTVIIQRNIPIHFQEGKTANYFTFAFKKAGDILSDEYKNIVFDRTAQISLSVAGPSESGMLIENISKAPKFADMEFLLSLSQNLVEFTSIFTETSPVANRYFARFAQNYSQSAQNTVQSLLTAYDFARASLKLEKSNISDNDPDQKQKLNEINRKETLLIKAQELIKNNLKKFYNAKQPLTYVNAYNQINTAYADGKKKQITIDFDNANPYIRSLTIDWGNDKVFLNLHKDFLDYKQKLSNSSKSLYEQLLINEIAAINRFTNETVTSDANEFIINLDEIADSKSFLSLNLSSLADSYKSQIKNTLIHSFHPKCTEFQSENFPVTDYPGFQNLSFTEQKLGLVVIAPVSDVKLYTSALKNNSIYVVAKGLDKIYQKYQGYPDSPEAKQFFSDFKNLQNLLKQNGFWGYSGKLLGSSSEFYDDYIFEKNNYYNTIINAAREQFTVHGTQKYALLEFTNREQRLLTINKIETRMQEDLLKWRDDYNSAQISIYPEMRYDVPKPTKNALLSNLALSAKKYFRGDERKIIHWGLDLSGGKTVQIELRDKNNRIVKDEAAIKQGINELYNRVNKMGVSEVSIRSIGNNIVLDFPGSQELSAYELIKASSMYFHVVNEKFSLHNAAISDVVNKFLQEVWNEAVVTNKKDLISVNAIAFKHLYGESFYSNTPQPRSESAKVLYENGLRLASENDNEMTSAFNDSTSKIAILKGDDYLSWQNQTHPLMIVFNNYVIEGSDLDNIRGAYDPSRGNFLTFDVKGSYTRKDGQKLNPREDLHNWTSHFSKEKIAGTPLENYSKGKGWRMAVLLNDYIISSPNLESTLKDSAMITGNFSVREVNQLTADLKAGSMSFTPHILSEKNVSPDLGKQERFSGVTATFISIILVIGLMVAYYRFAGLVASAAVLFNLLIMWATLQNIQAALTLAGIAGIVLTVGMAVDANVLVFERIKEEFSVSNRLLSAVQNGYSKAFSAIFDSNITTIIAALILLHFDSGPIKGFAVTLIIGIASSMFTALFVTRYFFNRWLQNPNHTSLKMADLFSVRNFNFLKKAKYVIGLSLLIIVLGNFLLVRQRHSIFGMDFTGGSALTIELEEKSVPDYRFAVEKALLDAKVSVNDIQIRELAPANNLRIMLGTSLEQEGKPFYNLPQATNLADVQYSYQNNPRIVWIVSALQKRNLQLTQKCKENLDKNWTIMSGQMSDSMRNNAIYGLSIALLCILVYITFRFEFKYAFSAMVCLVHDVLISLAMIAILNLLGLEIQIDLNIIAALMTIIGYSLNDTIVVFDRIREDVKYMRKSTFSEVVNHAINVTLNRTIMTSATVLVALFGLVLIGKSTIFGFSLVMLIGVVFGTLSSIFIASPLMLYLHNFSARKEKKELPNGEATN